MLKDIVNDYITNSLHLTRKYARIYVCRHYLFRVVNSFLRAQLEENCELRRTDNVQGQISKHILAPNGGYCAYYLSNLFRNMHSFENWGLYIKTYNVQGQFHPKWWLLCLLSFKSFSQLGNILGCSSVFAQLGNIRPHDAFRPIACEQKYLMDYNLGYSPVLAGECTCTPT